MSALSVRAGPGGLVGLGGASIASTLAAELAEIEQLRAPVALELPPELVRLGVELPHTVSLASAVASPVPDLATLREVERIGAHLGGLERASGGLSEADAEYVNDRLARVRVLVDCASALADLRAGVLAAMRTARAA